MTKKTAILISRKWALGCAAIGAALLRCLKCRAEVFAMDKVGLCDFLKQGVGQYDRVFIVGIPFSGDEKSVVALGETLKRRGLSVEWVGNRLSRAERTLMKRLHELGIVSYVTEDGWDFSRELETALRERFGEDVSDLTRLGDLVIEDRYCVNDETSLEIVNAALWFLDTYGLEEIYGLAIRALAEKRTGADMDSHLSEALAHYRRFKRRELIGNSVAMVELRERVKRVSQAPDARVMIFGETGTGKETVAMQIHYGSERRRQRFIAFNCATVSSDLIESRFFGYEKGAFTGADKQTKGLFEMANGGTLFLDEIGEMPLAVQGTLLRVLEDGCIMRMGGTEEIPVDVRIVTATHRDLPAMVRDGKFRADLYQRLCIVQIRMPPLREHLSDIPDIVRNWASLRVRPNSKWVDPPSDEQFAALMDYDYPGNVRELINILERSALLGERDFVKLMKEHRELNAGLSSTHPSSPPKLPMATDEANCVVTLEEAMRRHVRFVYEHCGGNLAEASRKLDVSRNTVRKYL